MAQFLLGFLLSSCIAGVSYRLRLLSVDGAAATFALAFVIFGFGGWQWTIPILIFFLLSSVLSKFGRGRKEQYHLVFEKSDVRDAGQVLANGGVAGALMVSSVLFPSYLYWYEFYLGSLAAVTSDTWGTEIGLLAKRNPRSVITFREVEAGTSGAITLEGIVGAAIGASVIAGSGAFFAELSVFSVLRIAASGLVGSVVDSLLGATLQAQYRCSVCSKITERKSHCGAPSLRVRGLPWMNNDIVNWICAIVGGACVMAFL